MLMKTPSLILLFTFVAASLMAQSQISPLAKKRSDDTLLDGFKTGGKTISISAAGTLEWVSGATLTGGSYLKAALGMGSVENTALSTWAGSTNQTTLGTVTTGVWHGTAIGDTYISSASIWNAKESALTFSTGLTRSTNTITLATSGITAGSYGSSTQVARYTVDAYGRITAVSAQTITPAESVVTFTDITTNNASTSKHGYLPKLDGNSAHYLDGTGAFSAPPSGLTIGSTAISGSTSGYVLYANGGFVGQLATTGSGSVVRDTSPTMTDAMIMGYALFGNVSNWARRSPSNGDTEFNTPTSQFTFSSNGSTILTVSSTGIAPTGIIAGLGASIGVPGGYPTIPSYEHALSGRSFRPGVNTTAFANVVMVPGDIYDGAGITITDAATLYVQGEPYQHPSGAAIGGNKWALWIAHGPSRFDGPVALGSGGTKHTKIKSGVATLVAGTVTVSDSDVLETGTASTSSRILVTRMTDGGTLGTGYSITRVNATSFTITSTAGAETSTLSWMMINP